MIFYIFILIFQSFEVLERAIIDWIHYYNSKRIK
ncbi:IS3 family transposase [Pseudolactococcus raffinolactis]|nr:IS3 family transposase [Lactococcus raffinolactis]